MIAESTRLAQVEELVVSTSAEDNILQTLKVEPSTVLSVHVVIIS